MNVILIIVIAVGLLLFAGIGLLVWLDRQSYKYKFLLLPLNGNNFEIIKAKKMVDKKNKKLKYFSFKNNTSELPIKEPNGLFKGKNIRVISFTPTGDYSYVDKVTADKDNYLKYSLEPEERELALRQFNENQRKYSEVDKTQLAVFFGMIALAVLLMIGIIYSVISFTKNADLFGQLAKENTETTKSLNNIANTNQKVAEILSSALLKDTNATIIRQVS